MNKNKVKDKKDKVVGSVKEAAGKVVDNEELELKGKLQKDKVKAKEAIDHVKEKLQKDNDEDKEKEEEFTNKVDKNNDFIMEGRDPDDCY